MTLSGRFALLLESNMLYIIASVEIVHPVTRNILVNPGQVVTFTDFTDLNRRYGLDSIPGHTVIADNREQALAKIKGPVCPAPCSPA